MRMAGPVRLAVRLYCFALGGAVVQSRIRRRVAFSASYEWVHPVACVLNEWMIIVSAGCPAVPTMAAPPAVVPPVADPPVRIVT